MHGYVLRSFALLGVALIGGQAFAQPPNDDCDDASTLCAQQGLSGNNTGATGWPGFCPGTDNVLWYTFTTNSVGGIVNVSITGINCPGVAGMDNELSVIVLEGDGSCTSGTFSAASLCQAGSSDFVAVSDPLLPGTQYWVIVAGAVNGGATIAAQCDFNIAIGGPGANIVGVDFDAGPDMEIGEGEIVQLHATGGTTYNWSPTDGLNANNIPDPFAELTETTTYTVTTVINGCTYSDQVVIEVIRRIDPPNSFTPNGDGINDTWEIHGISDYPNADVGIYDRWGQRVFRANGYSEPWDGGGLPPATYYYVIELNQLEGRSPPYTGFVAIIR
jgi:gliding motility-associated-like protein